MRTLQLSRFGSPDTVVELVEAETPEPQHGQVLVAMEASPVNPSDLLLIRGWYGHRPALPATLGTEGIGRILAVGGGVDPARAGERVLVLPTLRQGTWQDIVAIDHHDAIPIGPDADPLQLAMLGVNPVTADLLLRSFVDLAPGSWVGQTGGTSSVGRHVVALARRAGLRTLSVVRRPEARAELLEAGADAVLVDGPDLREQLATALGEERLSLLLDAVAGEVVTELARWLAHGGTLVSYGGMSGGTVSVAPADLIFKDLRVHAFWQKHWLDVAPREQVAAVYSRLAPLVADGTLQTPVAATYPLEKHRDALAHAATSDRTGKILFAW